jgi:glyoxylase-like metal-dependent hydrolase (beta-lactamase superfamily II)
MCFVHDEAELVFTGDHILDPTTPNVSINRFTYGNPLADYIVALARMREFGDVLGLPGHQDRVTVARRADAIIAHHEAQLDSVTAILAAGPGTVREVAEQMRWSFDWDEFGPGSIFMATGEALAHLAVLELRGAAEKVPGKPTRWRASAG